MIHTIPIHTSTKWTLWNFLDWQGLLQHVSWITPPSHRWSLKWVPVLHQPLLASLLRSWLPSKNHPTSMFGVTPTSREWKGETSHHHPKGGTPWFDPWWDGLLEKVGIADHPRPHRIRPLFQFHLLPIRRLTWHGHQAWYRLKVRDGRCLFFCCTSSYLLFFLWTFESKLKTYYFHMIHDIPWHTWWILQNGEMRITRCHSMADGVHPNVGRFWWWLNDHRMVRLWFDSPLTQKGGESKLRNILVSVCVFQAIGAIGLVGFQRFSYIF